MPLSSGPTAGCLLHLGHWRRIRRGIGGGAGTSLMVVGPEPLGLPPRCSWASEGVALARSRWGCPRTRVRQRRGVPHDVRPMCTACTRSQRPHWGPQGPRRGRARRLFSSPVVCLGNKPLPNGFSCGRKLGGLFASYVGWTATEGSCSHRETRHPVAPSQAGLVEILPLGGGGGLGGPPKFMGGGCGKGLQGPHADFLNANVCKFWLQRAYGVVVGGVYKNGGQPEEAPPPSLSLGHLPAPFRVTH